jgi:hypothetical protein
MIATVKMMNGELIVIEFGNDDMEDFDHFKQRIVEKRPDIPNGCLMLYREVDGEYEEAFGVINDDFLHAFVDVTRVTPFLMPIWNTKTFLKTSKKKKEIECIVVQFFMNNQLVSEIGICFETNLGFALEDSLTINMEKVSSHFVLYKQTPQTIWYPTIQECLLSVKNPQFPTNQTTLNTIQEMFIGRDWYDGNDTRNEW